MRMRIEPLHLLAYALGQSGVAYAGYFHYLGTREVVAMEDEDRIRHEINEDKHLTILKDCLTRGIKPTEKQLHDLRDIYFREIPNNNSHSTGKFQEVLYLAFGYDLNTHTTALERYNNYKNELVKRPFVTDIAVFVEELNSASLGDNKFLAHLELFNATISVGKIDNFFNSLHYIYNMSWYENEYRGTYHALQGDIEDLRNKFDSMAMLNMLYNIPKFLMKEMEVESALGLYTELLKTDYDTLEKLLNNNPMQILYFKSVKPKPASLKSFLESVMMLGVFAEELDKMNYSLQEG